MVFQPFLDQSLQRPARGHGYAVSLALHGLVTLLLWLAWRQLEPEDAPERARLSMPVSLRQPHAPRAPLGPEAPVPAAGPREAGSSPSRRARPHPTVAVELVRAPDSPARAEPVTEDPADEENGEGGAPDPGPPGGAEAGGPGSTEGGSGEIGPAGRDPTGRRPLQLFGRVVGGGRGAAVGPQGLPYAALKESTALRTYDVFPPLPAAQWTGDRPYLIVLDVCVSGDGQVSDVALVKPASRVLDPVVLEAVRTWRYKPRLVDGNPRAFCHVVAIKYEQL
jgi:hypothetical protein